MRAIPGRSPDIGLVLACYNEAGHFQSSMREILAVLDATRWTYEIIFVDDGSKDETRALIDAFIADHPTRMLKRIFHEKNTGRGGAVSDGFRACNAPIVGYIDIDLELHARYIPSAVLAIERGADVVVAWRVYKFNLLSLDRYIMSQGYHLIEQQLLGLPLHDTESGYKFFRRERLLPLLDEIEDQGWFWDTEVVSRAQRRGYKITEFPALFVRRLDKKSTVHGIRDSIVYLDRLLRYTAPTSLGAGLISQGARGLLSVLDYLNRNKGKRE